MPVRFGLSTQWPGFRMSVQAFSMSSTRRKRSLSMMMAHRRTYSLSIIATGIAAVAGAASGDGTAGAIGVMATIAGGAIAGVSGCSTGSRLFAFTQFRTENRYALFLELLFVSTQFRTENRYALFLELPPATGCAEISGPRPGGSLPLGTLSRGSPLTPEALQQRREQWPTTRT